MHTFSQTKMLFLNSPVIVPELKRLKMASALYLMNLIFLFQVIDLINPDTFNYTASPLVRCLKTCFEHFAEIKKMGVFVFLFP